MRTTVGPIGRLLGRLGRHFWVMRIDRVLNRAHECGVITSQLWHELDDRLKRTGDADWYRWPWTGWTGGPQERRAP